MSEVVQTQHTSAPVKKVPKKELVGLAYNISNFEGENIEIAAGQLEMKHGIFV